MKQGSATANSFGTLGVFYSALGVGLSFVRNDDDLNTIIAATLTGHLYKATGSIVFSLSLFQNSNFLKFI